MAKSTRTCVSVMNSANLLLRLGTTARVGENASSLNARSGKRFVSSAIQQQATQGTCTELDVQTRTETQELHTDTDDRTDATDTNASSSSSGASASTVQTGSAKLFADALLEEDESPSYFSSGASTSESANRVAQLIQSHAQGENWTGDERIEDTVLRMLVDKYKPLRGPVIRSAEEKMKESPPAVGVSVRSTAASAPSKSRSTASDSGSEYNPDWSRRAGEPLLPAVEGHRPWNTTFTPPSTLTARVKSGSFGASTTKSAHRGGLEEEGRKPDIAALRRNANAQRLGRARESTLDYKLGMSARSSSPSPSSFPHASSSPSASFSAEPRRPPGPTSLKAWSNLIEERIERARLEGQFTIIKGRGKPLVRENAEVNPFIAREEFLMNRIVQRNQAAPAWVELQGEVEDALRTFRSILRQSWTRRAVLYYTSNHTPSSLSRLSLSDTRSLRDAEWVNREAGYHDTALREVNEVVRRYNGVAPYAVRKAYYTRSKELDRCFWESGEDVLEGVKERLRRGEGPSRSVAGSVYDEEQDEVATGTAAGTGGLGGAARASSGRRTGIWEMIRAWIASLRA